MPQQRRRRRRGLAALAIAAAASAVTLSVTPAQAAEGTIQLADSRNAVPGSYIVVLDNDHRAGPLETITREVLNTAHELTGQYGGAITSTFSSALTGYAAQLSEEQARRIAADPDVSYVQQNQRLHALGTQQRPPSWGIDRIDQRDLPLDASYTYPSAAGVTAYVIDTGVRISHSDLKGRASHGFDAIDGDNDATDGNGHGTHVAGTIAGAAHGVAKDANIVGVRVLDNQGSGTTAQVVAGIDWVTKNHTGPSVANMSLGGTADRALDDAVRRSIESGVTYSVAAGNGNIIGLPEDAGTKSPARVQEAITVSATDNTDSKAFWANYGDVVDVFAPGVDITSSWNTGDDATNKISGTSMAAPHVAGAAALYLGANPGATPAQVQEGLVANASVDKLSGTLGSANRLLYTGPAD